MRSLSGLSTFPQRSSSQQALGKFLILKPLAVVIDSVDIGAAIEILEARVSYGTNQERYYFHSLRALYFCKKRVEYGCG
jgi:hypothetical protein